MKYDQAKQKMYEYVTVAWLSVERFTIIIVTRQISQVTSLEKTKPGCTFMYEITIEVSNDFFRKSKYHTKLSRSKKSSRSNITLLHHIITTVTFKANNIY